MNRPGSDWAALGRAKHFGLFGCGSSLPWFLVIRYLVRDRTPYSIPTALEESESASARKARGLSPTIHSIENTTVESPQTSSSFQTIQMYTNRKGARWYKSSSSMAFSGFGPLQTGLRRSRADRQRVFFTQVEFEQLRGPGKTRPGQPVANGECLSVTPNDLVGHDLAHGGSILSAICRVPYF